MSMDLNLVEFSILELEDRLEFAELCDNNCGGCGGSGTNSCTSTGGGTGVTVPVSVSLDGATDGIDYSGGGGGGSVAYMY